MPEYHEGQIVDALYRAYEARHRKADGDAGEWRPARIQGVDFKKRVTDNPYSQELCAKKCVFEATTP